MGGINELDRVAAPSPAEWRAWLAANHESATGVWLVFYKKKSGVPSISWSEAVDEALCFGWIDSKVQSIDDAQYEQYFTLRKPTSPWSKINKEKIAELEAEGRLAPAGVAAVAVAKENGSWSLLDSAEALLVPDDLAAALGDGAARSYFDGLPASTRRSILQWILLAKRPDTRARRIRATADAAAARQRPNNF